MAKTQVYLIGAGPGDPELITKKACRILAMVDVVLYDYLVHPNIILMIFALLIKVYMFQCFHLLVTTKEMFMMVVFMK